MKKILFLILSILLSVNLYANITYFEKAFLDNALEYEVEFIYYSSIECNSLNRNKLSQKKAVYLLNSCRYNIDITGSSYRKIIKVWNKPELGYYKKVLYSRVLLDIHDFFKKYFPKYNLSIESTNSAVIKTITFGPKWYEVSLDMLKNNMPKYIECLIDEKNKRVIIKDKLFRANNKLYYGLLYKISDYNKDLYELVKGYFSNLKLMYYLRDNKLYILLSKPAESRENCVKTYMYLKSLLDDKWNKSIKLGEYFPKKERQYLLLLYQILSASEIKPFKLNEIKYVSYEILVPKGLDKYRIKNNIGPKSIFKDIDNKTNNVKNKEDK